MALSCRFWAFLRQDWTGAHRRNRSKAPLGYHHTRSVFESCNLLTTSWFGQISAFSSQASGSLWVMASIFHLQQLGLPVTRKRTLHHLQQLGLFSHKNENLAIEEAFHCVGRVYQRFILSQKPTSRCRGRHYHLVLAVLSTLATLAFNAAARTCQNARREDAEKMRENELKSTESWVEENQAGSS